MSARTFCKVILTLFEGNPTSRPSRPKIEQKTCVTWIYATTACQLNVRSGYSGTWRQMPLPLRSLCREAVHKERSIVHRQLCVRPARLCSTCYARREKNTAAACPYGRTDKGEQYTPSLGRPTPHRDDKSVDALERLSRRVAEPFRASLLAP